MTLNLVGLNIKLMNMISYRTLDLNGLWEKFETRDFEPSQIINRQQIKDITRRLSNKKIEVITGPRQSGKTTLLFQLIYFLQTKKNISSKNIFYINLDSFIDTEKISNPLQFVQTLEKFLSNNKRIYLFIDEIQRLENPGRFLKGIYDLGKKIKIFITGSSSIELKSKIKEYLTGRKIETLLLPVSFTEFVEYENIIPKTTATIEVAPQNLSYWNEQEKIYGKYLTEKLNNFTIFGSYPEILLLKNIDEKIELLGEIYSSYITKDVIDFMNVAKITTYKNLVIALASQIGNLISKTEISSLLGNNLMTISKYLTLLEETFIIHLLPPILSMKRNEIKSSHKLYFIDNGIRNYAVKHFGEINSRSDVGQLIENLVFAELLKNLEKTEELYFWRTKSGAEVDFVIKSKERIIPIEVKISTAKQEKLSKSFHSFIKKFEPRIAVYLNKDYFGTRKVNGTNVFFIPVKWFLVYGLKMILT